MNTTTTSTSPPTPFPIHRLAHNYYLYSTPLITSLRSTHSIPGTLIGTLPQCPQQNLFLGLPLLLSPAETRLLVHKRFAYIVDDAKAHREGLAALGKSGREEWKGVLRREGEEVSRRQMERMEGNRERVLKEMEKGKRDGILKKLGVKGVVGDEGDGVDKKEEKTETTSENKEEDNDDDELLFPAYGNTSSRAGTPAGKPSAHGTNPPSKIIESDTSSTTDTTPPIEPTHPTPSTLQPQLTLHPHRLTPTTSHPPLAPPSPPSPSTSTSKSDPNANPNPTPPPTPSTALHNHLVQHGYFLLPGLRFGCHFSAYPGDPLRFHSHFLCRGYEWGEDFALMDLVGGGRLGTGVKKGWLVGGMVVDREKVEGIEDEGKDKGEEHGMEDGEEEKQEGEVRCFCIEWGGM